MKSFNIKAFSWGVIILFVVGLLFTQLATSSQFHIDFLVHCVMQINLGGAANN